MYRRFEINIKKVVMEKVMKILTRLSLSVLLFMGSIQVTERKNRIGLQRVSGREEADAGRKVISLRKRKCRNFVPPSYNCKRNWRCCNRE